MNKKEEKDKNSRMTPVRDAVFHLSSEIKRINKHYDQSIKEINAWKKENHRKLDEIERQINLRYEGTVIDVELLKRQKEEELYELKVQEDIKKEQEACEALSREINELLGNDSLKETT